VFLVKNCGWGGVTFSATSRWVWLWEPDPELLGLVDNPDPKHYQKVPLALGPASQLDSTNIIVPVWGRCLYYL